MLSERFPKHKCQRQALWKRIGKLNFNKMKNEALRRHYLRDWKDKTSTHWEKVFANYTSDKRFIFNTYKKLSKLKNI